MTSFCTYCSAHKDRSPGRLPAIRRYLSSRIQRVYQAAGVLGAPFYILSAEYGLLAPEYEIPYYDHLLQAHEVDGLADRVAEQLRGIGSLAYLTKPVLSGSNLVPYHDAIAAACTRAGVRLCVIELREENMASWRAVMEAADKAKLAMVSDRSQGESQFEALLRQSPNDGMIYFKRGEAYEALGDSEHAAADFQRAMALFPMPEWKARGASDALKRVRP